MSVWMSCVASGVGECAKQLTNLKTNLDDDDLPTHREDDVS